MIPDALTNLKKFYKNKTCRLMRSLLCRMHDIKVVIVVCLLLLLFILLDPKLIERLSIRENLTINESKIANTIINTSGFSSNEEPYNINTNINNDNNNIKDRENTVNTLNTSITPIDPCPNVPDDLEGPVSVDVSYEPIKMVEKHIGPKLFLGGRYHPKHCSSKHRVAIVVPYRNREQQLPIFLKNLHPFLMKQQIDYGIFIVEQFGTGELNRGKLKNVGFVEARKMYDWDCVIFHDVDLLPMDDRNLYTCPEQPRHMSVAVNEMNFKLPYDWLFGGVVGLTVEQCLGINGFSNSFWGWGGEDDDMSHRLSHHGYQISRYSKNIARYTMLIHKKDSPSPIRYKKLKDGEKHFDDDGLNSLTYKVLEIKNTSLYIWIHVDVNASATSSRLFSPLK